MIALKGISRTESKLEKFKNRVRTDGGTLLNYDTIQGLYSGLPALVRSDASMVMLPCGYKSGKVYGLNGNDFTFSRGSNATRINSSGLIELVSSNIPRINYNQSTLALEGLLIEKASTNLFLQSENFSSASWGKSNVTISANTADTLDPSGGSNATKATINTAFAHNTIQAVTVTANTVYTFSFYVKRGTATDLYYSVRNNNGASDIIAPTSYFSSTSSGSWKRVSITFTTPTGCTSVNLYLLRDGPQIGTVYFYGAQVEASSVSTSYIPTTTASATRAADSLSIAIGSWFVGSEGTLYADYNSFGSVTTNRVFSLNDGTANNSIHADLSSYSVLNGGVSQAAIGTTGTSGKIATVYKVNDFALVKNGGAASTDTSGTIPTVNTLKIGSASSAGNELNGTIKALAYFPTRRTNSELQTLTT